MSILEKVNFPNDLQALKDEELPILAQEIRDFIINTVSKTGGHLGPNLGVVELSIALHKVFNVPKDKIIWDVGHQSYIHKIFTGRRDRFDTLRKFGGIAGFPNIFESEYDAFGTGHASTSLSAAVGMAIARDIKKEDFNVVAVIGDGALTGGMALEALNNAGDLQKKLLIVLNDNEMSIAKNVGAMSEYLYRMRTGPTYSRIKNDVDTVLKSIPTIGDQMLKTVERVKNSVKFLLVPGMLFEELGFNYIGPVDGHDVDKMVDIFEMTKHTDRPTVVHILTCKGKGYAPAEKKAASFHGVGPFSIDTGNKSSTSKVSTYTEIFSSSLINLAEKNEKIVAITAAMPDGTGLTAFSQKFPKRFFDVGIAEQHAVTLAAGIATQGLKPVVAVYSTFAQRAYDQILHDVCLQNLPVVFALDRTGLVGDDGATHHGVFTYSYLRNIPNMVIMAPEDENELSYMLKTAIEYNGPVALVYPRGAGLGVEIDDEVDVLPIGKAKVIEDGKALSIWAIGSMVDRAKKVSTKLQEQGIKATIVNARFVKPIDNELLFSLVKENKYLVTMEENVLAGGFGSAILEQLGQAGLLNQVKVLSLGFADEFITHGDRELLLDSLNLDIESMVQKIADFCKK